MKKILLTLSLVILATMSANAADKFKPADGINPPPPPPHVKMTKEDMAKREAAFEQKLGLTEEQKLQARELRKQGFEKIKPVMVQIKAKREEARKISLSDTDSVKQQEELAKKRAEIKKLESELHKIRHENMKEFEKILTPEQQKTLKTMKQKGKKNFHKNKRKK